MADDPLGEAPVVDPGPDPRLRHALWGTAPDPAEVAVDWEALRRSIAERAALPLARRAEGRETPARRSAARPRVLVPLLVAASVALLVGIGVVAPDARFGVPWLGISGFGAAGSAGFRPMVEEALGAPVSDPEFELLFSESIAASDLLRAAVAAP